MIITPHKKHIFDMGFIIHPNKGKNHRIHVDIYTMENNSRFVINFSILFSFKIFLVLSISTVSHLYHGSCFNIIKPYIF